MCKRYASRSDLEGDLKVGLLGEENGEVAVDPAGDGGLAVGEGDLDPVTRTGGLGGIFFGSDGGKNSTLSVWQATDVDGAIQVGRGDEEVGASASRGGGSWGVCRCGKRRGGWCRARNWGAGGFDGGKNSRIGGARCGIAK